MSEPTNAPRVWLRWALALALATGTVAGSMLPALALDEATGTEAPADQSTGEDVAPVAVDQAPAEEPVVAAEPVAAEPVTEPAPESEGEAFADVVAGYLPQEVIGEAPPPDAPAEDTTQEQAPPAEASVAQDAPADAAPVDESSAAASSSETTPYYDPPPATALTTNPIFPTDAGQEALAAAGAVTEPETTAVDGSSTGQSESGTAEVGSEPSTDGGESAATTEELAATAEEPAGETNERRASRAAADETQLAQNADTVSGGSTANESEIAATLSESTAIADGSGGSSNTAVEANERETRGNNSNNNGGGNGGNDNGNDKSNDNGDGRKNNRHRKGLLASRVAALNGRAVDGDTAAAGNGGRANASADGGIVVIGTINSGGNQGNTIAVDGIGGGYGECGGGSINGGNVDNSTNLNIDAGGGTAIGDASGGNGNLGVTYGDYTVSAGNGGVSRSSADGGIVVINEINSGGNAGNTIDVGSVCGGSGGTFSIDGGNVNNSTNIDIDASGGTAIADASGGDDNLAVAAGDEDHEDKRRRGGLRGLIQSRYGLGGRGGLAGRVASAGNGGRANASADGGIVVIGEINSGGNRGNTINVGGIGGGYGECGPVSIDGGNVDNSTNIDIDAGGGTAIADASGGSGNLAAVDGNDDGGNGGGGNGGGLKSLIQSRYGLGGGGNGGDTASAGNGGIAGASADGGIVVINDINSGGNQGNTIEVGDICVAPVYVLPAPAKPGKPTKPGKTIKTIKTIKAPTGRPGRGGGGGKVRVSRVPSTGVGHIPTSPASVTMIPIAVLPVRREDEDGVHYEDNWIR